MSAQRLKYRRMPLAAQLWSVLALAALGLALIVALVVTDRDRRAAENAAHRTALRSVQALAQRAAPLLERGDDLRLAVLAASVADVSAARVLMLDANGVVRLDTGLTLGGQRLAIETGDGLVTRPLPEADGGIEILAPALSNSGFAGEVRMRYRAVEQAVAAFAWDVFGTALLCAFSLALLAWWIVHQWLLRLRAISSQVRALGSGEATAESLEGPALGELTDALRECGQHIDEERKRAREAGFDLARRLTRALEQRGLALVGHGDRTRRYAMLVAEASGLPPEHLRDLGTAATLIDLGKAAVRASALEKRGDLTEVERESLRQAPVRAASFLSGLPLSGEVAVAIRHHHEKYDGTGYPDGLRAERIPLASRILAIADAYDLLTSSERGGAGSSWPEALERMHEDRGEHFDPMLLDAFDAAIRRDPAPARPTNTVVLDAADRLVPYKLGEELSAIEPERDEDTELELDMDFEVEVLRDERESGGADRS